MNPLIDLTNSDDEGKSDKRGSRRSRDRSKSQNKMLQEMLIETMVQNRELKAELHREKLKSTELAQKVETLTNELKAKNFVNSMLNMSSTGNLQPSHQVKIEPGSADYHGQKTMRPKTPARRRSPKTPRYSSPMSPPSYSRSPKTPPRYPSYGSSRNSTKTPSRPLYYPPRRNSIRTPPPQSPVRSFYNTHRIPGRPPPHQRRSFKTPSKFNDTSRSFGKSPAKGPKYMIENIGKDIEDSVLYDCFKGFGEINRVNVREKGVEKLSVENCSAFLQFDSNPREGFLEATHTLNGSILTIREFVDGNDTEKVDDDWNESEIHDKTRRGKSQSRSPPHKYQRSESRGRIDVRKRRESFYPSENASRNRSPSSSSFSSHNQKTRTIAIKLMFQLYTEDLLKSYFSKFGEIHELKGPMGKVIFLKFKEYKSAEEALSNPQHFINGEKYWINAAEDR